MTKTKILVLYTAGTGSTHKGSINQFYFANCAHLSAVLQKQHYSAKHYTHYGVSWKLFALWWPQGLVIYHVTKFWN